MNDTFKLGRSIAQLVPYHLSIKKQERQHQQLEPKQKRIITKKLVIPMEIIAIAKIAVFVLWI
jgi:hypothetical protein